MSEEQIKDLLINLALNDDHLSFKKIYFFYYDRLFQLAKTITRSSEASEEIVDDVFMKIWLKRTELIAINNLTVYLYVAIKNHALNYIAKSAKVSTTSIDDVYIDFQDITPGIEERLISADLAKTINNTIQQMPAQCKLVFKLVKEDNLKYKEVAEILNISTKTVEYHIANALKKIAISVSSALKPYASGALKKYLSN